jgi:hypothetical protein
MACSTSELGLGDDTELDSSVTFDHLPEPLQQRIWRATGVGCIFALLPRVCRGWRAVSQALLAELVLLDTRDVFSVVGRTRQSIAAARWLGVSGEPPHHKVAGQLSALLRRCSGLQLLSVRCQVRIER